MEKHITNYLAITLLLFFLASNKCKSQDLQFSSTGELKELKAVKLSGKDEYLIPDTSFPVPEN